MHVKSAIFEGLYLKVMIPSTGSVPLTIRFYKNDTMSRIWDLCGGGVQNKCQKFGWTFRYCAGARGDEIEEDEKFSKKIDEKLVQISKTTKIKRLSLFLDQCPENRLKRKNFQKNQKLIELTASFASGCKSIPVSPEIPKSETNHVWDVQIGYQAWGQRELTTSTRSTA